MNAHEGKIKESLEMNNREGKIQSTNKLIKAENKDRGNDTKSRKPFVSHVSFKWKMFLILLLLYKLSAKCLV